MGKLIMNGVPYGGGDVEANPSGTATDTLTKLGIEGIVYEIQGGGGGSNLIVDAQIYSEDEKVVGVWTDGKPLYQKTYANVNLSNNQDVVIDTNVSTMQLKSYVIDFSGMTNTSTKQIGDTSDTLYIDSRGLVYWINRPSGWWSALNNANITVWYTKTTDSAGSGGYQAYGFSPIIYSTEEREVGVWTDNKPLYAKVIDNLNVQITTTSWLTIANIPNGENLVDFRVFGDFAEQYVISDFYEVQLDSTNGDLNIHSENHQSRTIKRIYVQYTKTTDTAGSGEYNTLGIPNVHYDGNEKVIGTYFGETLYQQCIDLSNITISTGSTVTVATIQGINLKKALGTLTETDDTTYAIPDGGLRVKQYGDDIKLTAMSGSSWAIAIGKLIIEYTKTS